VSVRKNGLVVPAPVVQRGPNGSFAYVINPEKKAEMRTIEVAQIEDGYALIDNGLEEGEQVVVDGQYKLQPNAPVQVQPPSGQPSPSRLTQAGPSASPNKQPADHGSPAEVEDATKGKHRSREGSQRQTEGSVSPASSSQG
jgi:multidrug efflux system membrane fusion protein